MLRLTVGHHYTVGTAFIADRPVGFFRFSKMSRVANGLLFVHPDHVLAYFDECRLELFTGHYKKLEKWDQQAATLVADGQEWTGSLNRDAMRIIAGFEPPT